MRKKGIIFISITAVVGLLAALGFSLFRDRPETGKQRPHTTHLRAFLAGTGLTFVPVATDDFIYYNLYTADRRLSGFVFLGTEAGWGGPINLFVKTDTAGTIQRVHVWHHTETPIYVVGLDAFLATFAGHHARADLVWQQDVHGITGATVTAEAIIAAVSAPGRTAHQRGIFMQGER